MDESQGKCSRQKLKQRQEEYLLFLAETAVYFIYPRDAHLQSMDGTIHSGLSPTKSITKQDNDHTDLFTDQCDGGNPPDKILSSQTQLLVPSWKQLTSAHNCVAVLVLSGNHKGSLEDKLENGKDLS